jgi:hypothetical protein
MRTLKTAEREVAAYYRLRDGYWGAECPQVPELVAGDASLADLIPLVHAALRDFTGIEDLKITDVIEESAGIG